MFNWHPAIKILCVGFICVFMAYLNYLLFNDFDIAFEMNKSHIFKAAGVMYVIVVLLFADYHFRKKSWLLFGVWIALNLAIMINAYQYYIGSWPPWYSQYSQSTTLSIYTVLLLFTKERFPNWLRLFAVANLIVLVPCIWFYFEEMWDFYIPLVYIICFLPMIKALVFLERTSSMKDEVIDD